MMTGVKLELLANPDMHLFVEKGIRGDIFMVTKRSANAKNPYISQPSNYLMYFISNNLYGRAMSQSLPTHNFVG